MRYRAPLDWIPFELQAVISVFFDVIGMATYLLPGVGELFDIIWAPIQYFWIRGILGPGKTEEFLSIIGLAEELLPFTDAWPSCTVAIIYKAGRN